MGCCNQYEEKDFGKEIMSMADCAWSGLMKEKMKAVLEKERGSFMDKAAEIAVKASIEYHTKCMSGEKVDKGFFEELNKNLKDAMHG